MSELHQMHTLWTASVMMKWLNDPVQFVRDQFKVEPDEWQKKALRDIAKNPRLAMKACKGPGKAQPLDTMIYTPRGSTRWGDLNVGDEVFDINGGRTKIKGIYPQGVVDTYRVAFDDRTSTLCCGDHLWKVRGRTEKRHNTWSVINTKEIIERGVKLGGYNQFQIPAQGSVDFISGEMPIDAYTLGVWLGDGSKRSGNVTTMDREVIEMIEKAGYKTNNLSPDKKASNYTIYGLCTQLKELDLISKGSHERFVPETYKTASIEDRERLLTGLMDSDGTIDKRDGHCEYDTTSKQLADDVAFLVRSLGGKAKFKKTKNPFYRDNDGNKVYGRACYRISITLNFNPFIVERKRMHWKATTQDRHINRTIVSIDKVRSEDSMCIEVEHADHCYLTNDFIVTHNSCVLAWIAWWYLVTHSHARVFAVSITADNLSDGLWTELAVWLGKSKMLQSLFTYNKTSITYNKYPETWYMKARSFSKSATSSQQADTLAGKHAPNMMFLLDETGDMPVAVLAAAEAVLANEGDQKIAIAGNPTSLDGILYHVYKKEPHLWSIIEISSAPGDPMRTPRVTLEYAQGEIDRWGWDHPYVLVNIRGLFPPKSFNTLLGPDEVYAAVRRQVPDAAFSFAEKRLGVDVALYGDDNTVIFPRQGLAGFNPIIMKNEKPSTIGSRVMMAQNKWRTFPSEMIKVFVDDTGGWGSGVTDFLSLNRVPGVIGVNFSEKADEVTFGRKRAEIWWRMAEWVKGGGCLPNNADLIRELTEPYYFFHNGRLEIEPKKDIKKRLGRSPDIADGLALTFSQIDMAAKFVTDDKDGIQPASIHMLSKGKNKMRSRHEPFKRRNSIFIPNNKLFVA